MTYFDAANETEEILNQSLCKNYKIKVRVDTACSNCYNMM